MLTDCHRISILGLARDAAHEASTRAPKSLIIRARETFHILRTVTRFMLIITETRQTYRAVLSEPVVIFPENSDMAESSNSKTTEMQGVVTADTPQIQKRPREDSGLPKKKKQRRNKG